MCLGNAVNGFSLTCDGLNLISNLHLSDVSPGSPLTLYPSSLLPQYGIVLDAGSSHTAVYIYKWPSGKQNGTGVVTRHTECQVRGKSTESVPIKHDVITQIEWSGCFCT